MTTFDVARQPAGQPSGGEFAERVRQASGLSLVDDFGVDEREYLSAGADAYDAAKRVDEALTETLGWEVAHVARHAREQLPGAHTLVFAFDSGSGSTYCHDVLDAEGVSVTGGSAPAYFSEDISDLTRVQWRSNVPDFCLEPDEDFPEVSIEAAMEWEVEQRGGIPMTDFSDRRQAARTKLAQARKERALASLHSVLGEVSSLNPQVKGAVVGYDDSYEEMSVELLLDADGATLERDPGSPEEEALHRNADAIAPLQPVDMRPAGAFETHNHEGRRDGCWQVSLDALRRLRGVADDPNQPSLLPDYEPGDFGWSPAAA